MNDWNVVITAQQEGYPDARQILGALGTIHATDYFNVLVMRVDDPRQLLESLREWTDEEPGILNFISHVIPITYGFNFSSPDEFEKRAKATVEPWIDQLKARRFHVRMHRRGFKERISSQQEEQFLDHYIQERLKDEGSAASIDFDDPDIIIDVETVGQRAGMSLWTRSDLERYGAFLGVD